MLSRAWPTGHACRSYATRNNFVPARRSSAVATAKHHDPLHVLFCGADDFSIYSLRALHELQKKCADKIESIDVVCRPDKRVGRGLKQVQEVPIKGVATELGLKLHQIDTFKGWLPPTPFDLIVTVSFGLLVPARIIKGARYGGLNVHPSLLPEFRGPAPIQHTLLQRRTLSGVTLQTMHPTKFDHGMVLDQTRTNLPLDSRYQDLVELLAPLGAKLLAKGIYDGVFIPPLQECGNSEREVIPSHAPKITPEDRHIDWRTWTAEDIILRDRVLGRLWDNTTYGLCMHPDRSSLPLHRRATFHGPWRVEQGAGGSSSLAEGRPGTPLLSKCDTPSQFGIVTADNRLVVPAEITIEGESRLGGQKKLTHVIKAFGRKSHHC
ncbi:hypothetical protein LTR36_004955 [Oleoguttula mirabilis]|uniref:methionyl-tRNA formyltransferase n=1 Tax=Oleoguttula mirabilis TaxID=1507867 RepID=A0AAV9JV95_9PEZI|nr:hypothetical protein LTR36_004955 [Oleoguttula mirabilis]